MTEQTEGAEHYHDDPPGESRYCEACVRYAAELTEKDAPVCDGDGGSVFTYEGPQFGAHIEEEPCRKCDGWHESPGERESRLRWENRRRPIRDLIRRLRRTCVTPPAETHDHAKCCHYLRCAHPTCCGYYGEPPRHAAR